MTLPRFRGKPLLKLAALIALAFLGCEKKNVDPPAGASEASASSASASASVAFPTIPSGMFSTMPRPMVQLPPPIVKCRVMASDGKATVASDAGAVTLRTTDVLADGAWIDLDAGSKVGIKVARSGRELSFMGPGRVRVCIGDDADTWLVRGRLDAGAFGGEPAGAELWIGTPLGAIRYPSTRFTLIVDKDLSMSLETGTVWFFDRLANKPKARPDLDPEGFLRISTTFKTAGPAAPTADLVHECDRLAGKASDLAGRIRTTDGGIGALAAEHVAARRTARGACLWASTEAAAHPADSAPSKALAKVLAEADVKWRTP